MSNWEKEKIEAAKGKTRVAIVIDKSSSMGGVKEQTVAGYNETLEELQEMAKENDVEVSLVTFDNNVYEHLWNVKAQDLKKSNYDSFQVGGCTAMRDGLGYTIDKLAEEETGKNDANLIIVISDGYENSSKHVSPQQLRSKIEELEKSGNWTFTYMGCSGDNLKQVEEQTGIQASNMAVFDATSNDGVGAAFASQRTKLKGYGQSRSRGLINTQNFHSDTDSSADYEAQPLASLSDSNDYTKSCSAEVENGEDVFGAKESADWSQRNYKAAVENLSCQVPPKGMC